MILVDGITAYSASMTRGLPGRRWCHMVSDVDEAELHAFAAWIGMSRSWAQLRPKASAAHYDLTPSRRARDRRRRDRGHLARARDAQLRWADAPRAAAT